MNETQKDDDGDNHGNDGTVMGLVIFIISSYISFDLLIVFIFFTSLSLVVVVIVLRLLLWLLLLIL